MRYISEIATSVDTDALEACIVDNFDSFKASWPWGPQLDAYCTRKGITRDDVDLDNYLKDMMRNIITNAVDPERATSERVCFVFKDTENSNQIMGYYIGFKEVDNDCLHIGTTVLRNGDNGLKTWLYTYWEDITNDPTKSASGLVGLSKQYVRIHTKELLDFYMNSDKGFVKVEDWTISDDSFSSAPLTIRYGWGWD
jgi:hypothetical protein